MKEKQILQEKLDKLTKELNKKYGKTSREIEEE